MSAPPRVDPPRVDVAVPGSEGTWLVRALAEAGFDAHHAPTLAASTDADVIVAEASLEDFPERARPLAGRLFVIGWEPLDDATREALADPPFQRRPVAIADLVRALREQTGWEGEAPPASPSKAPPPVRERTMQLDLDDEEPAAFGPEPTLALADSTGVHPRPDAEPPRSEPPPPPTPVPPRPSSQATTARAEEGEGVVVVTFLVAAPMHLRDVGDASNLVALKHLVRQVVAIEAENLSAIEVIWSPAEEDDRMSTAELEVLYPELRPLPRSSAVGRVFCAYCGGPFAGELEKCPHCGAPHEPPEPVNPPPQPPG